MKKKWNSYPQVTVQEIKIWPCWKWYMCEPESILETQMKKILWHFLVRTGYPIQSRRPDIIIIIIIIKKKKKIILLWRFCLSSKQQCVYKKNEKTCTNT